MNKILKRVLIVYLIFAPLTYGGNLAYWQGSRPPQAKENCRKDIAGSVALALIPPGWLVTFFFTGFYQEGLQWTCEFKRRTR